MRNFYLFFLLSVLAMDLRAQVGIGTGTPNSTLDVRGSFSAIYRSFTSATSLTANDHTVVFTGGSATTATLPDASTCVGRIYCIKNFSTAAVTPALTIGTVSSQKIDGVASWILDEANETIILSSDGANWEILSEGVPAGGTWNEDGNNVSGIKALGTISNYDLPFITNNTEQMRITTGGYVGIGSTSFSANPEALLVYQNNSTSFNVIAGKGNLNNYLQLNIQNQNSGTNASSDVVATADNGNEISNYVDMGINSSGNASGVMGGPDDAYLYTTGNNFLIGTGTTAKSLIFMTGGTTQSTYERMRISGSGNVGIGTAAPAYKLDLEASSNPLYLGGVQTGLNTDSLLTITGGVVRKLSSSVLSNSWALVGNSGTNSGSNFLGTTDLKSLRIRTNNVQRMIADSLGNVAIGSAPVFAANPEKLLVDAGTTTSFNVINGKGTINNYLQLNIQNKSSGTNASSDVVATADNGNETANYIDMGINSSGNTSNYFGNPDDAYLYDLANNFLIGTATAGKSLIFLTGGGTQSTNERMRIDGSGKVGIGTNSPAADLDVSGTVKVGTAGTPLNSIIRFTNQSITDNTAFTYNQSRTETFALAGVNKYASVIVTPRTPLATGLGIGFVIASGANTVEVTIINASGATLALGTVAFDFTVIQ